MVFNTFMFLWLLWLHIHVFVSLVSHPLWFTFCNSFTIPTQVDFLKTITNSFQIKTSNEHKYGIWFKVITNLVDKREQSTTFQYRKKTTTYQQCKRVPHGPHPWANYTLKAIDNGFGTLKFDFCWLYISLYSLTTHFNTLISLLILQISNSWKKPHIHDIHQ